MAPKASEEPAVELFCVSISNSSSTRAGSGIVLAAKPSEESMPVGFSFK